jgi:GNAT superfamily N-acetyltransferase
VTSNGVEGPDPATVSDVGIGVGVGVGVDGGSGGDDQGPEVPAAALRLWRELVGDQRAFAPGMRTVARDTRGLCPRGWTGIVRLGDAYAIEPGDAAPDTIAALLALDDPADPEQVLGAVTVHDTLGPGELAYRPAAAAPLPRVTVGDGLTLGIEPVGRLERFLAALPDEDVRESSVGDMDEAVVLRLEGTPVAAAGHLRWPADIAHIGILVAPAHRGRGHGRSAGAAAVQRAEAQGSSAQWRAATDNLGSRGLAAALGFVEVGRQLSVDLAPR